MLVDHRQIDWAARIKSVREKAGLSREQVAAEMGMPVSSIWDLESVEDEMIDVWSPAQMRQLCRILGCNLGVLFRNESDRARISPENLIALVLERCRSEKIALESFEERAGWTLSPYIECPDQLMEVITIEGLTWLCRELEVDWRLVMKDP